MWFMIAVLSAIVFGATGFLMKVSQMAKGSLQHLLFGLYLTGALGFFVNSLFEGNMILDDLSLWLAGLLIGLGSAGGNLIFMKVLEYGPASLSSPLMNMYVVLIVLVSTWFYKEPLSLMEIIAIIFIFISIVLISVRKEPITIKEKKWYLLIICVILLFAVRNGGLKVTEEMGMANTQILFLSYLLSCIWFGWTAWKAKESTESIRVGLKWGTIAGFFSYGGLQLYAVALAIGKANVVIPIFATNSLVMVFGSILLYKERLNRLQKVALFFLLLGLVFIKS